MDVSRRGLLRLVGPAGSVGIAGCGAIRSLRGARIEQVRVVNKDTDQHTVHVLIEYNGDLVQWTSVDVPPAEGETSPKRVHSMALDKAWPDEAGHFVVYARLDEQSDWQYADSTDSDFDCLEYEIGVPPGKNIEPYFADFPCDWND